MSRESGPEGTEAPGSILEVRIPALRCGVGSAAFFPMQLTA